MKIVPSRRGASRREFLIRSMMGVAAGLAVNMGGRGILALDAESNDLAAFAAPGEFKVKYHGKFAELPLGAVKPRGWIKQWLLRQADGLTGHPENLAYPFDTCMYSGKIPAPPVKHGEDWWPYEQSGYFVDGATRLNHLIENAEAAKIPAESLKYILENSGPGKLGESVWGWPNTVVGRALMAQYGATGDAAIPRALSNCILGTQSFFGRDADLFEEALYLYGLSGNAQLLEIAKQSFDHDFVSDPRSFSQIDKIHADKPLHEHGVTAAEQLKLLPLMYCYTGDEQSLELANLAYRKVEADSLMPDGGIVSSEGLGPTAFNSLHETCDISDWSWSFGYMLMASGDAHWADRIEQMIFNALPGAVTKDFKQLQYFSSVNQILASSTACPRIAPTRMSYRAAHETQCCSGNVNRAMPNYVTRMWARMEGGLVATLLGPSEVRTVINGQAVAIVEETDYPFRENISFKIAITKPITFSLGLRIPKWCDTATVQINGKGVTVDAGAGTIAVLNREFRDGDVIELQLPMRVQLKNWFDGGAVSVERGPLVFPMTVAERRVESAHEPDFIRRFLVGNNVQGFPAVEFFPAGEWRYGIDAAQLNAAANIKVIESQMTDNPFVAEHSPLRIEMNLRTLPGWAAAWQPISNPLPADWKQAPKNPASLPGKDEAQNPGPNMAMTLLPYGATHLRLTTLPVIKS
jgi:uncharacterized protein